MNYESRWEPETFPVLRTNPNAVEDFLSLVKSRSNAFCSKPSSVYAVAKVGSFKSLDVAEIAPGESSDSVAPDRLYCHGLSQSQSFPLFAEHLSAHLEDHFEALSTTCSIFTESLDTSFFNLCFDLLPATTKSDDSCFL